MRLGKMIKKENLTLAMIIAVMSMPAYAESLFKTGVSQNAYPVQPRSLYSSVKAKTIGDLVTVLVQEEFTTSDDLKLDISKQADTQENFRDLVNKVLPGKIIPEGINNFGGQHDVGNTAKVERTTTFEDTITAQVVQVLPNGNLVIQGKKTAINADEKVNVILSGVVDPRLLDGVGRINSNQIANLQIAIVGKGTISRSNDEGVVNKFIRYMF